MRLQVYQHVNIEIKRYKLSRTSAAKFLKLFNKKYWDKSETIYGLWTSVWYHWYNSPFSDLPVQAVDFVLCFSLV